MAVALAERFSRVAVVHEWLTIPGGSEKVVSAILELLPQSEVFTSVYDPETSPADFKSHVVHRSFLDRVPGARRYYPYLLPLMDAAFRSFDLSTFDLVISSNHACAKNVRTPPGAPHVCYCHTPMRYAWDPEFLESEALGPMIRRLLPLETAWLRRIDRKRAAGPDVYVANSTFVATRIVEAYGRPSQVIHPPVEVSELLDVERDPGDAYLVFGRLVPYKRIDIAIRACERMGRKLIVAGSGRDLDRLRRVAGPGTEFLGHIPDEHIADLFSRARALIFPGVEDFGMVPVEAQAAGLPVIAYGEGGVCDSVIHGQTGVLYPDGSVDALCQAIELFESMDFDERDLRANAARFAPEHFAQAFDQLLGSLQAKAIEADTLRTR
ncbi:MAG TPA: glycosyltransferase [Solirubrobacteraceae bacterium]|nr:glycosyltransferase [Solirubrobacteraceae bacterium]